MAAVSRWRAACPPPVATAPAKLSAHVFRRTYITLMAEAGARITYVQDQVGQGAHG
jgi:integrase